MNKMILPLFISASAIASTIYIDYTVRDHISHQIIPKGGKITKDYFINGHEPVQVNPNDSVRLNFWMSCSYADSIWIDGQLFNNPAIRGTGMDNFHLDFGPSDSVHTIKLSPYLPTQLKPAYMTTWIAGAGGTFSIPPNRRATMEKTWECPGYFGLDWLTYPIYVKPDSGYLLKSLHIDDSALAIIPQGEMYDPNKYHYHANRGGTIRAEFEPASVYNLDVDFNSEGGVVVVNKISKLDSSAKLRMPASQASVGFLPRRGYYIDTILLNGMDTIGSYAYTWNAISGKYRDSIRAQTLFWQSYDRNNKVHVHFAPWPTPSRNAIVLHLNDTSTRILRGKSDPRMYKEGDTLWFEPFQKDTLFAANPHKQLLLNSYNVTSLDANNKGFKVPDNDTTKPASNSHWISNSSFNDSTLQHGLTFISAYHVDNGVVPYKPLGDGSNQLYDTLSFLTGTKIWHTPRLHIGDSSKIFLKFTKSPSLITLKDDYSVYYQIEPVINSSKDSLTSWPYIGSRVFYIDGDNTSQTYANVWSNNKLLPFIPFYFENGQPMISLPQKPYFKGYSLGDSAPPLYDTLFIQDGLPRPVYQFDLRIDSSIHGSVELDTNANNSFYAHDSSKSLWSKMPFVHKTNYTVINNQTIRFAVKINPDLDMTQARLYSDENTYFTSNTPVINTSTSDSIYGTVPVWFRYTGGPNLTSHPMFSFNRKTWHWTAHSPDPKCIKPQSGSIGRAEKPTFAADSGYLPWTIRTNGQQTFFDLGLRQVRLPLTLSDSVGYFDIEVECVSSHPESLVWQDPVVNTPVIPNPRVHWKLRNREISGLNPAQTVEIYDAAGTLLRTGNADATGKFNLPPTLGGRIIVKVGSTVLNTIIP